ncbi:MAG: DUF5615 family PIN-like protein [Acidobacteriota bacterium]|nr:MAG: DUF5615 family PIN-like protein [Acidobacteriota bacterium]
MSDDQSGPFQSIKITIDFQRAPELNLHTGVEDPEVLRLCAEENRLLVTHDRHTMPGHFIEFIKNQGSPGIFIISRRLSIGKAAEWLALFWEASEAEEHRNQIIDIP